jgi:hypothetical protein
LTAWSARGSAREFVRHTLVSHPRTPERAVREITARVSRASGGVLTVAFALEGALDRLRIPDPAPGRRGIDLWRHTCFEAFVGRAGASAYHEINLAPSGEWTVYAFRGYRDGGPLDDPTLAPRTRVRRSDDQLALDAEIDLARLASDYPQAPLRIGVAVVAEAAGGTLSYWALRHPPGAPDFHHADGFVIVLEAPTAAC